MPDWFVVVACVIYAPYHPVTTATDGSWVRLVALCWLIRCLELAYFEVQSTVLALPKPTFALVF